MTQAKHFYEFGSFRLDATQRLLLREGVVVPLTLKAFDLLITLVKSDGQVLTKDELMHSVWPDSFVEEANLSHHIHKLREALGEREQGDKYIETLARRGYRFVAKVTEVRDEGVELQLQEHSVARVVVEENEGDDQTCRAGLFLLEREDARPFPSRQQKGKAAFPSRLGQCCRWRAGVDGRRFTFCGPDTLRQQLRRPAKFVRWPFFPSGLFRLRAMMNLLSWEWPTPSSPN